MLKIKKSKRYLNRGCPLKPKGCPQTGRPGRMHQRELDGYEFNEIYDRTGQQVYHVMFIDSHYTFWGQGKSYLCRFIDILNMGLIDELIVGKEVLTSWREVLTEFAK